MQVKYKGLYDCFIFMGGEILGIFFKEMDNFPPVDGGNKLSKRIESLPLTQIF